jgi:hypothetical protein
MPDWYSRIRSELQAHFDVVEIRYRTYDTLGKLRVASFRGGFLGALLIAAIIVWLGKASTTAVVTAAAVVSAGLLISVLEHYRREKTIRDVAGQLGARYRGGRNHHVIAHSFGTFLLPRALMRTTISIQNIVFAGSVLPRRYDWRHVWRHAPEPFRLFHRLRNEFSTDWVVSLAGFGWSLTGCGWAGARGFSPSKFVDSPAVHDVERPWGPCSRDPLACLNAPIIHNVALGDYGHSGVFLSNAHARDLWLPTFWSYEPYAYGEFAARCGDITQMHDDGYPQQGEEFCETLLEEEFPWFGTVAKPRSIREVVERRYADMNRQLVPKRVVEITKVMAELLVAGWLGENPDERPLAYPARALAAAIAHTA